MECCGVNSYLDWAENPEYNKENTVPDSCCIDDSSRNCAGKVLKTNDTSNIYTEVPTDTASSLLLGVAVVAVVLVGLLNIWISCFRFFAPRVWKYLSVSVNLSRFLLSDSAYTAFQLPTLPRILSSTRPESTQTLALYTSFTYLFTYWTGSI